MIEQPVIETAEEFCYRRLREIRETEGAVSSAEVAQIAAMLGKSERTVWRRLREPRRARGCRRFHLNDRARELFYLTHGNVNAVHRHLAEEGLNPPSRPTLYRAFMTQMDPAERAYAIEGEKGWRAHQVYVEQTSLHRNATWEADHKELSIEIFSPSGRSIIRPWVTVFINRHTRAIMGWSINETQTSADVIAALRTAIQNDPERGPFCGVPDNIVWDNGREFLSDAVTNVCRQLRIFPRATKPFMPHHKGRIERFNRTLEQMFLRELSGWKHGAKNAKGDLYGGDHRLTFNDFTMRFEQFIHEYNHNKPHRGLDGRTPLSAWESDATPLRTMDENELRWMALPSIQRTILSTGVSVRGISYAAPQMSGLGGERVEVRYMPHDQRKVEIWRDGHFFCDALPQDKLTAEDQRRFTQERHAAKQKAGQTRARVSRLQRGRQSPTTHGGVTPDDVSVLTYKTIRKNGGLRTSPKGSRAGSLDLLGLDDLNKPIHAPEDETPKDNPT